MKLIDYLKEEIKDLSEECETRVALKEFAEAHTCESKKNILIDIVFMIKEGEFDDYEYENS